MASAVVSIQKLIIVWYMKFEWRTDCFLKSLGHGLENVINCPSVLPFLPPGCLRKQNLAGKFPSFDQKSLLTVGDIEGDVVLLVHFSCNPG